MQLENMPREKALELGISSLSNNELLALILKSGYKSLNVFQLVDNLLNYSNGFYNILSLTYDELIKIKGIKKAKALELMAILEIYKRLSKQQAVSDKQIINSPERIYNYLKASIGFSNLEEFWVIYLNTRGSIIKSESLFKGTKDKSLVAIDEILRRAIILKCSYLIVAHNHPSDNVSPSQDDIILTEKLESACKLMGIVLIDHLIITKSSYFSFKKMGLC